MKKFKAESQKVLDMMINSIYTNKEIFLRELLSNCSDALDKLYFKSLNGGLNGMTREDFKIEIEVDKDKRTLTISDNGIGMTKDELENNLGVIAKSGSQDFKNENKDSADKGDISIIGQFGVGFYSAFMVADKVEVLSKAYGSDEAYLWVSSGAEGYDVKPAVKATNGTQITLYLKPDTEDEKYSEFLEEYKIRSLVKKYSDYIKYPIKMMTTHYEAPEKEGEEGKETQSLETINSMTPLWKKNKNEITEEEYNEFYKSVFMDYEDPLKVIHMSAEGVVDFKALLFIPANAPYNYYSKNYEKGLKLYTNGVLIADKNKDLLPDYFGFVKGIVDSEVDLNVSRETVQQSRQLKLIASNIEKKIKNELTSMLETDREKYEKFYKAFGLQLKFGLYESWGSKKDVLQDLLMFHSVKEDKLITFKEYVSKMSEDQKYIYYATGKSVDGIKLLPQCEKVLENGYDILCFTDDVDEFAIKFLTKYDEKEFRSVSSSDLGLKEEETAYEDAKEITDFMKEALDGKVADVKISARLKSHPVCISAQGDVSVEMEKVLNANPNKQMDVKAEKVLEINANHPIYGKIKSLFETDKDKLKKLTKVLYAQAQLIEGLTVENPTEITDVICGLLSE